jgi:hypothetical protein
MPLFTFATAKAEMSLRMGGRQDILAGTPSRADTWLNAACILLCECDTDVPAVEVRATKPTVIAQGEYSLIAATGGGFNLSDVLGIRYLRNSTTGNLLEWISWLEYRELNSQASGSPSQWSRNGNLIALDPKPAAVEQLLIEYRRYPTPNVLDDFTDRYHDNLVSLGVFYGWTGLRQYEEAAKCKMLLPGFLRDRLEKPMNQYDWEAASGIKARVVPYDSNWR